MTASGRQITGNCTEAILVTDNAAHEPESDQFEEVFDRALKKSADAEGRAALRGGRTVTGLTDEKTLDIRRKVQAKLRAFWTPERRKVESERAKERWKLRKSPPH
ncbi:hypothetical protein EET67_23315 [Pseudaminobacter arsenicus]|uniref:Uncharacterized protein n=1 Tax=Borborobacter arsenicus TaxID=1851146 RepID=A0A432UZP5_9HYPH|nr:hypothetical protein [Pseudaminobacter arsenicus]RUM95417.1 hypothetical protein EET67_23315 [Pseudaminobacter arsenicus]